MQQTLSPEQAAAEQLARAALSSPPVFVAVLALAGKTTAELEALLKRAQERKRHVPG